MVVNREMLIKRLSERSGYVQQDIRGLLKALDDVVLECFAEANDEEEVVVQLVKGIRCGVKIMPERQRKDPRTQDDIVCKAQTKPFARFSDDFREKIQTQYEEKKGG